MIFSLQMGFRVLGIVKGRREFYIHEVTTRRMLKNLKVQFNNIPEELKRMEEFRKIYRQRLRRRKRKRCHRRGLRWCNMEDR